MQLPTHPIIIRLLAAGLILFLVSKPSLFAQEPTSTDRTISTDDAARLIARLESSSYQERNRASRQLARAGVSIVRQLVEQIVNGPPESASRCTRLLSKIALQCEQGDMTRIARILQVLSQNGFGHLKDESLSLNARWKQAQLDRIVQRLSDAGIQAEPLDNGLGYGLVNAWVDSAATQPVTVEETPLTIQAPVIQPVDAGRILDQVDQIVAATDVENETSFEEELRVISNEPPQPQSDTDPLDPGTHLPELALVAGSGRIVTVDGGVVFLDSQPMVSGFNSFSVTISDSFKGSAEDLELIKLLPSISQMTIANRPLEDDLLEVIRSNPSIQYLVLESTSYDVARLFELMNSRPGMAVSSSGHDTFLGVQLNTERTGEGVEITVVVEESAAESAGCRVGDVIQKIGEIPVNTYEQVLLTIGSLRPDETVTLEILRDKEVIQIDAVLGTRPPDP